MPTNLLKPFLSLGFLLLIAPMLAGATPGVGEEVVGKVTEITGSAVAMQDALPRALTPFGVFSTRSFNRYHVSAFQANGTVTVRVVSGSQDSTFSRCELP